MKFSPWWAALALAGIIQTAHAGLFDDDEARKAIVDLRGRVSALEDQNKAQADKATAAAAQLADQIATIRRSLLDLNNQLEELRGEIATLRGNGEQIARDLADVQSRQKDMSQAFDDRLRKLEPTKVSLDGHEFSVDPDEKRAYDEAIAAIRSGDFDNSSTLLSGFLSQHPGSPYTDSVRFWLGNALYGKRDYKGAIAAFRAFVAGAPDNVRAPEALLALANCQAEMKDTRAARKTLDELIKTYPQSESAQAAKERRAALR